MRAVLLKRPSGKWSKPFYDAKDLRRAVNLRLAKLDEPFTIVEVGVGHGPGRNKGEAAAHFVTALMSADVGAHYQLRNDIGKGVFGRVVEEAPLPAKTSGSPGVDAWIGFLNQEFAGDFDLWGIYSYRHIAGSASWSDHAYVQPGQWCGRAADIHPHSIAIGDEIYRRTYAEPTIAKHFRRTSSGLYLLWRGVPNHYPGHLHGSFEDGGYPGHC